MEEDSNHSKLAHQPKEKEKLLSHSRKPTLKTVGITEVGFGKQQHSFRQGLPVEAKPGGSSVGRDKVFTQFQTVFPHTLIMFQDKIAAFQWKLAKLSE